MDTFMLLILGKPSTLWDCVYIYSAEGFTACRLFDLIAEDFNSVSKFGCIVSAHSWLNPAQIPTQVGCDPFVCRSAYSILLQHTIQLFNDLYTLCRVYGETVYLHLTDFELLEFPKVRGMCAEFGCIV